MSLFRDSKDKRNVFKGAMWVLFCMADCADQRRIPGRGFLAESWPVVNPSCPTSHAGGLCLHPFPPILLPSGVVSASPDDSTCNVPMVSAKGEPPPHTRKIEFWKAHLWHLWIVMAPF